MIKEAIEYRRQVKSGEISVDSYMIQMGGMVSIGKMMDRHVNFITKEKILKISLANVSPELVGYNPEVEKVKCPALKKPIERRECLDFSGENKFEECVCEIGVQTKNLLLPETTET